MATVRVARGEIYRDKNLEWRFRTLGANGEVLWWGEGYHDEGDCLATLEASLPDDVPIHKVTDDGAFVEDIR
jgi:uncharacterized protein YegP (UPF0339 family)